MSYSPIILPVLALVFWFLLILVVSIPGTLRVYFAISSDRTLTEEEQQSLLMEQASYGLREHSIVFYVICLALAQMGVGSGLACWVAWVHAASWATAKLPRQLSNAHLRCVANGVASISLYALAIYAGIRVTQDVFATIG